MIGTRRFFNEVYEIFSYLCDSIMRNIVVETS